MEARIMKYFALIDGISVPISEEEFNLEEMTQLCLWGKVFIVQQSENVAFPFKVILQSKQVVVKEYKPINQKS